MNDKLSFPPRVSASSSCTPPNKYGNGYAENRREDAELRGDKMRVKLKSDENSFIEKPHF